ncbi:MAG: FscB [Rhodobacteraceae bacterium]|nr:FscB [Paracoccaceae bacterium]
MTHILHLGHQVSDLSGVAGLISTDAVGFDPAYDVNCIKISTTNGTPIPFSARWREPTGDVWLGFRYRAPSTNAAWIAQDGLFLEFFDSQNRQIGMIRTERDDDRYRAMVTGDTNVDGASTFIAATNQTYWIDVKIAVGASITIEFYVDGVLYSTATAANAGGKGRPVHCLWRNLHLFDNFTTATWYYAHIAVLDGVSTIGRRFARRTPDLVATYDGFSGGIDAIKDDDTVTRVASDIAGQRLSFSLAGPTGPAGSTTIAGVHVKQLAQLGTAGPTGIAGFLRMGGVDYDATPETPSADMASSVYSSWALNPADSGLWSLATLPAEVGIVSS